MTLVVGKKEKMADPKGFLKHTRELPSSRNPEERINDYREIYEAFSSEKTVAQASRCMDWRTILPQWLPLGQHHS